MVFFIFIFIQCKIFSSFLWNLFFGLMVNLGLYCLISKDLLIFQILFSCWFLIWYCCWRMYFAWFCLSLLRLVSWPSYVHTGECSMCAQKEYFSAIVGWSVIYRCQVKLVDKTVQVIYILDFLPSSSTNYWEWEY